MERAMRILRRHFKRVDEELLRDMAKEYVISMIEEFGEEGAEGLVKVAAWKYRRSEGEMEPHEALLDHLQDTNLLPRLYKYWVERNEE